MPSHPQADVHGTIVFFFIKPELSHELDLIARDGDLAREAHKLQLPNRSAHHCRPGPEKAQGDHYRYR